MKAVVEVSGQFGGREAGKDVVPHFLALKRAEKEAGTFEFPLPKFCVVIRADGEIQSFDPRIDGEVELPRSRAYVSVDIHLSRSDIQTLRSGGRPNAIATKLRRSVRWLAESEAAAGLDFDQAALQGVVEKWAQAYEATLPHPS